MADFRQNTESQEFKKQFARLLEAGKIRSQTKFAEDLGWDGSSLSLVLGGKRNVPEHVLMKFDSKYGGANKNLQMQSEGVKGNITYIPARAQAGYLDNFADQSFINIRPKEQ
jgi:hypothetical protein